MTYQRRHSNQSSNSIYRRMDTGRWVACIIDPTTGKRIQKDARSERETRQKLNETKSEIKQRRYIAYQSGCFRREHRQ